MSLYDYQRSHMAGAGDVSFAALIMAAALRADTFNLALLRAAFPAIVGEAQLRYNAAGGRLPTDPEGGSR